MWEVRFWAHTFCQAKSNFPHGVLKIKFLLIRGTIEILILQSMYSDSSCHWYVRSTARLSDFISEKEQRLQVADVQRNLDAFDAAVPPEFVCVIYDTYLPIGINSNYIVIIKIYKHNIKHYFSVGVRKSIFANRFHGFAFRANVVS